MNGEDLLVLYVEDPMKTMLFFQALGLYFVQEQHGTGPIHWACENNGKVFEIYPKLPTMAHSARLARMEFRDS